MSQTRLNLDRKSRPSSNRVLLAIVVAFQIAWLVWALNAALPNAGNVGGVGAKRLMFLLRFFPEVVPGVGFADSYLGYAAAELAHVENLPQRLPIVAGAALIFAAAIALGSIVLRGVRLSFSTTRAERFTLSFGLGMTALGAATLILGRLGLLGPLTVRLGLFAMFSVEAALIARERIWKRDETPPRRVLAPMPEGGDSARTRLGFLLVVSPFVLIMTLGAMLPTIDFDAIEYHLQGPKEYYQAGKISFLPHNVYTSMPFGVEMLHLLGMEALDDWRAGALVGQLLTAGFAMMTGLAVYLSARRFGSARAAWVAGVVYLTCPWVYRLAAIPYVEGPLCFYHVAPAWAVGRILSRKPSAGFGDWLIVGLLCGGAMAIKYPALISAVGPFGAVALATTIRGKSPRPILAYALGVGLVMFPWLTKNVIDTGNPVYPLAYGIFGGDHWDAELDAKWSAGHGRKPIESKLLYESIVDVAGRSDWQSPAFVALALLAFLRKDFRTAAISFGAFAVYIFATWWLLTHRLDRFWIPLLPALAVLSGLGADSLRGKAWTAWLSVFLALVYVTNLSYSSTALVAFNEWTGDLDRLKRSVPEMLNPALSRMDRELPPGAKPLLVGQAAVFHLEHKVVYNTVFNKETIEVVTKDRAGGEIRRAFAEMGVTHVYVDWFEVERYRSPGNYGFTDYVTPELFRRLVNEGVLDPPIAMGARQELYQVSMR